MILKIIQPTWGQAIEFAEKSGMGLQVTLALVAFAVAISIRLFKPKRKPEGSGDGANIIQWIGFAFFLVLAIYALYFKPGNIRLENEFPLEEEKVQYYSGPKGDFQPFFDSLYAENRLKYAPKR